MKYFYLCSECGKEFDITPELIVCPVCSEKQRPDEPLRGVLEVGFEGRFPKGGQPHDFLPIEPQYFPSIPVGNTPLWEPQRLRKTLRYPHIYLKDDTANPTGSLKDRCPW